MKRYGHLLQDLMMECLLYQIAELGCPNVCYAVDIKGSTLEKAEKQEVPPTVGSLFFSLQQFHYFGCELCLTIGNLRHLWSYWPFLFNSGKVNLTIFYPQTKKCLVYELKEPSKLSAHLNKYQKNMLSEEDGATSKSWDDNDYICYKAPNNLTLLFSENFDSKRAEVIATSYCSMDKM